MRPCCQNEKENWRTLTNKEIYAIVKKETHYNANNKVKQITLVWARTYRVWKKTEFPKQYYIWIWEQQDWQEDQEIDGKMK